jgi:hypothetical protein
MTKEAEIRIPKAELGNSQPTTFFRILSLGFLSSFDIRIWSFAPRGLISPPSLIGLVA